MRHAILSPFGSLGDLNPFLWLGQNLLGRGVKVTLLATPAHARAISGTGLRHVELGTAADYDRFVNDPDIWHPIKGSPMVFRNAGFVAREHYRILRAEIAADPHGTVLFAPLTAFGARLAREKTGTPLVTVHLQPSVMLSADAPPFAGRGFGFVNHLPLVGRRAFFGLVRTMINAQSAPFVNPLCREEGVRPPRDLVRSWWHSPDGVLCLFPDWFAPPQPDWPAHVHCVGFPLHDRTESATLDEELEKFLAAGAPPVVFTPGTAMAFGRRFFAAALAACKQRGWRAVFSTKFRDQLPARLPASVILRDYAPFSALLPRAAALVHHGGIGTLSQGLAAGVPQLVMALAHDQPDNGLRLRRLGVGDFLYPHQFTAPRVAATLGRLLNDPAVPIATAKARHQIESDNPSAALNTALNDFTKSWNAPSRRVGG